MNVSNCFAHFLLTASVVPQVDGSQPSIRTDRRSRYWRHDGEHSVTGYIKGTAAISRSSDPIERVM